MGSKNCPETPRQKMIGMMYLVLTAMLALNVSKDILNSFVTVNESMEVTNANFGNKVGASYQQFRNAYIQDSAKVGPNWAKAQEVQALTNQFVDYVTKLRAELLVHCGEAKTIEEANKLNARDIEGKDNYDKTTWFFLEGPEKKGKEFKDKIDAFRTKLLSYGDSAMQKNTKILETNGKYKNADGQNVSWENYTFYNTILMANIVNLNKIIGEAKNAEFDVVNNLYKQISATDFKFDKVVARVIPKSNYVVSGEAYEASVFVAAYDSRSQLEGTLNGHPIQGDSGMLKIRIPTGGTGQQKISGEIIVKNEMGNETYPYSAEYFVAQPSATVSATKMNVFYVGVENPVSISVPGANAEHVSASLQGGGSISKIKGTEYVVKVTEPGKKVQVAVTAEVGGAKRSMGSFEYRVKRVPMPVIQIAGIASGPAAKEQLLVSPVLAAILPDFDFNLKLSVTSFTLSTVVGKELGNPMMGRGNRLSDEMIKAIKGARRGQKLYFENIQYQAPEGTRMAPTMIITIK